MVDLGVVAPRHAVHIGYAVKHSVFVVVSANPAGYALMHNFACCLVSGNKAAFCEQQDGLAVSKGGRLYRVTSLVVIGVQDSAKGCKWFACHV